MTTTDFAKLVQALRNAQKRYFAGRMTVDLEIAKDLEKKVDAAVKDILTPKTGEDLFDYEDSQ